MVPSSFMISQITPAGVKSGEARQIHRRLGLAGAHQHAAFARAQRKHVAGPRQVAGPAVRVDGLRMVRARSAARDARW